MNYQFTIADDTFVLTQKQLDAYLDSPNPDVSQHWYDMLDSATYLPETVDTTDKNVSVVSTTTPSMTVAPSVTMPKKRPEIVTINAEPVIDWDKEWADVARMFDEFSTPVEKPVKRVSRAKVVKTEVSLKSRKAQVLEYVTVSGDWTVSKFRTAFKKSVYGMFCDITEVKLNSVEGWNTLWQAILEFGELDVNSRERMRYAAKVSNTMDVRTLKQECKNLGLTGYGKLKKDELITFILVNQA